LIVRSKRSIRHSANPADRGLHAREDRVREQVAATVSQLPLSVNDTVLGYINYFSNRGHRTIVAGMQRSGRYRPMIQRILDEEGVPQELIHLAQAESLTFDSRSCQFEVGDWPGAGQFRTRITDRMAPVFKPWVFIANPHFGAQPMQS
jgi:hypothetical protein